MQILVDTKKVDWAKAAVLVGAVTAMWTGLSTLLPERYFHAGIIILGSITSGISFLVKAEKTP